MIQNSTDLGPKIRALRLARHLSLAETALQIGISEATMSRIETGLTQVSAPHLYALAQLFGIDISAFFNPDPQSQNRRSLTRAGEGAAFTSPRLDALPLGADLRAKAMHPFLNRTRSHDLDQAGGLQSHAGEEFLHVLKGPLILHSNGYAPLRLMDGDSLYFDATDPHAYLTDPGDEAVFLVVSSHPIPKDQTP